MDITQLIASGLLSVIVTAIGGVVVAVISRRSITAELTDAASETIKYLRSELDKVRAEFATVRAELEKEQLAREKLERQFDSDIHSKDLALRRLDTKINIIEKWAEDVLRAAIIYRAQLAENHIMPAAELPAKPDTGPLHHK